MPLYELSLRDYPRHQIKIAPRQRLREFSHGLAPFPTMPDIYWRRSAWEWQTLYRGQPQRLVWPHRAAPAHRPRHGALALLPRYVRADPLGAGARPERRKGTASLPVHRPGPEFISRERDRLRAERAQVFNQQNSRRGSSTR